MIIVCAGDWTAAALIDELFLPKPYPSPTQVSSCSKEQLRAWVEREKGGADGSLGTIAPLLLKIANPQAMYGEMSNFAGRKLKERLV